MAGIHSPKKNGVTRNQLARHAAPLAASNFYSSCRSPVGAEDQTTNGLAGRDASADEEEGACPDGSDDCSPDRSLCPDDSRCGELSRGCDTSR